MILPQGFSESVIESVALKPQLWDPAVDGYKNRDIRAKLWVEVLKEIGKSITDWVT